MSEPREWTIEEVQDKFLDHIRSLVNYWAQDHIVPDYNVKSKLNGLAFSILSTLDGCSSLPGFLLIPSPHESDKEYLKEIGENWYKPISEITNIKEACLPGMLHELFYRKEK